MGGTGPNGGKGGATENGGDGGTQSGATGGSAGADPGSCVQAKLLWYEDWETGNYMRWTSNTYNSDWGNDCQSNAVSTEHAVSGTHSNRSEIVCAYTEMDDVQRGYGGVQFSGDDFVPAYTNTGTGIDAPFGVVNTFHAWMDTSTVFENGTWFSLWTVEDDCAWANDPLTLGLEDSSNRLAAAHYQNGGSRVIFDDAPAFANGRWVRVTVYVNYYDGVMHVWQDGAEVSHVTFTRPLHTMCQWHWGAYASGDNDDVVYFEDDNSIWKLGEPWTDLSVEPWFGGSIDACDP